MYMAKIGRIVGIIFLLWMVFPEYVAAAQSSDDCVVQYQDQDADGTPEVATILCPYAGNPSDRIYVYDRAGNMQATGEWETSVDFEDDLWIFDALGDGTANLVIDFHYDGTSLVADLYDDQDGDGQVSVYFSGDFPVLTESMFWTVQVVAKDGWWQQASRTNYNLEIFVDGRVQGHMGLLTFVDGQLHSLFPQAIWERVHSDGTLEYSIQVSDVDYDGHPDFHLVRSFFPVPDNWGVMRTTLVVNSEDDEAPPTEDAIFWPYLGNVMGFIQEYNHSFAPFQVDWATSKIINIAEFIASRGNDHNWFIYSLERFEYDHVNFANFENPFTFYDLAEDSDGYPELQVRIEHYEPYDTFFNGGEFFSPIGWVRYSWDQDNNTSWDFKVSLGGRHAIESIVEFPDFSVNTIPYSEMPSWVTSSEWDAATFVAVEDTHYWTTEGIYEWGISRDIREEYLTGISDTPAVDAYEDIPVGFRGEYSMHYLRQPYLYFSPIDRRLHLLGAEHGMANIDDAHYVIYDRLAGDYYINSWQYIQVQDETEHLQGQLHYTASHLIYEDENEVVIKEIDITPSLLEVLPPRNNEEWLSLGQFLDANRRDFAPEDFEAMYTQFEGPEWRVEGASLRDFRSVSNGFRFVLDLHANYRNSGLIAPLMEGFPVGSYLVTYNLDEGFRISSPLETPNITVSYHEIPLESQQFVELQETPVTVLIENRSLQDISDVQVRFWAQHEGVGESFFETSVNIFGQEGQSVSALWTPPVAGEWNLGVEIEIPPSFTEETINAENVVTVLVDASSDDYLGVLLSLGGLLPIGGLPLLLVLASLSVLAVGLFILIIRTDIV